MSTELANKTIAFLVANEGVEQVELTEPWKAVEGAGGQPVLVSIEDEVQGFNHLDKADTFDTDVLVDAAKTDDFDGLVLPGGIANPDRLRMEDAAVAFAKSFVDAGKPIDSVSYPEAPS